MTPQPSRSVTPSCDDPTHAILTVGHGVATQQELTELFAGAGLELIVDVRRSPGSRRHPHASRRELGTWLPAAGIAYRWEERFGGRRSRAPGSPNTGLRDPAMQGYVDHLGSSAFLDAVDRLLTDLAGARVALLCAESSWTACHRRFIADHLQLLHHLEVRHLGHDHAFVAHEPSPEVRVEDGRLIYDAGAPTLDLGEV